MRARKLAAMLAAFSVAACSGGGGSNAGNSSYPPTGGTGGSTPSGGVATNTMAAGNDAQFAPATIVVNKGTTVSFVFADTVHTLYFSGAGKPDDLPPSNNTTVTRTFSTAGLFTVYCRTHTYMIGFVSVQ